MDEIDVVLAEKPNAIIIYEGHNEYYGALGVSSNITMSNHSRWLKLIHLKLMDLRIYQLMQNFIFKLAEMAKSSEKSDVLRGTLMTQMATKNEIDYNGILYKAGIKQFELNLSSLLEKANNCKVPVFLSEEVSNIRDMEPLASLSGMQSSLTLNAFRKAKYFDSIGNYTEAKELYYEAKDLDGIKFRATEDFNKITYKLAQKYKVYFVPMEKSFEEASPNGIMGNNLFTEHLHPNIKGCFLMADKFYKSILESNLIKGNISNHFPSAFYENNWGYSSIDSLLATERINSIKKHWPFCPMGLSSQNYNFNKRPTLADSIINSLVSITEVHLTLAQEELKKADYENAFKDYYAIALLNPNIAENYLKPIECLIKLGNYNYAKLLITKSLRIKNTHECQRLKKTLLSVYREGN